MAYEIPQQLEYKEKIIFGLTFKQLAWALLFLPPVLFIFFKTGWNYYAKGFIGGFFICLAIGFMYLDFWHHAKNIIGWYRCREIKEPEKLKAFVGVKEIKDDAIITADNCKLAVLKVQPMNFAIKPQGSQEAITASFQKLLNSLDFPVQIVMSTESLNLSDYFAELQQKVTGNKQFEGLFEKYKEHLERTISQGSVINRVFYLIIPQKHDLSVQLELCQKRLENIGLKSSRLQDTELKHFLKRFFMSIANNILPPAIKNTPSHLEIGSIFTKILYAHGYPRNVEMGFLDKIVSLPGDFDLSLHIEPYDLELTMIMLNKELQKQRADLYAAQTKGILNPSLEIKYQDTKTILENLQKGKEKLFNVSLYINCRASSKEKLELLVRRVESELNALLIIPKTSAFRMAQAFQSCAPLAQNKLAMRRNVPTEALSAFFPFTSSFLQADSTGIWLGLNKNNIPIIKDIFKLSNPNGFCLASSGSGKSYLAKLMIARHLLHGTKVMVIDPQGEYASLVQRFNGQRIDLGIDSETIINPLDLMGHEYREKRLALMDLMPVMLGELTEPQKSFIDRAITEAYLLQGITDDPATWDKEPPLLEDVLNALKKMEAKAVKVEESTIRSLINRLDMYVNGVFSFLNKKTQINFNNRFVCFDIGSLPKQVKPTLMFLVLDYVYMKMKQDLERKLLVIDEAWALLGRTEEASYIFEIVKTCRKFNLALFLINQEVEGMLASNAGRSVLANSSYTILMRQKPAVIKQIQETFFLSNVERLTLLTAPVGEGLLLMDDEHSEIRIVASEEEHRQITTNPDELLQQRASKTTHAATTKNVASKAQPQQRSVKVRVDPEQRFFKHKDVTLDELKYLIAKGYQDIKCLNIEGRKERYLIKPRRNESDAHFFMVYDIVEHLKQLTNKIWLYETVRPDIIFEANGKKWAIEVETGKVLHNDKKKFLNKVKNLKKEFGNNWFFALTNRNLFDDYKKFGETYHKRNLLKKIRGCFQHA